jgi:hypothetical protein
LKQKPTNPDLQPTCPVMKNYWNVRYQNDSHYMQEMHNCSEVASDASGLLQPCQEKFGLMLKHKNNHIFMLFWDPCRGSRVNNNEASHHGSHIGPSKFLALHPNYTVKLSHYCHAGIKGERKHSSYSFLTSVLDGASGQCHTPAMLYPLYPLDRRKCGPQSWYRHRG